ncbi:hydrogenase maturation protease [bacterium]|nr:hydrogenase maturation protease [bacterium]
MYKHLTKPHCRAGKTLILGLGNTILTDDGVGIYVVRKISELWSHPMIDIEEAAAGGLELLDLLSGYERAILVDAVPLKDKKPGEFIRLIPDDLGGGSAMARHQVAFSEALALGRKTGMALPESIVIYGIQTADVSTFSEKTTPLVEECIEPIADAVWAEARNNVGIVTFELECDVKLGKIQELLDAEILTEGDDLERSFNVIQASDLMSDVLTQGHVDALLITGLVNAQAVRTAHVVDLGAIVFVRGKRPAKETVAMAQRSNLPLLVSKLTMFDACGRLYKYKNER